MTWRTAALVAGIALTVMVVTRSASTHGELDQYLDGYPQCTETDFPVTFGAETNPRQEFVPSGSLIASIEVCAGSTVPIGTTLTVIVREGTVDNPGDVLGEKSVPISVIAAWQSHANFDPLVRVKPDRTYVLEMRAEKGVFWRATQVDRYCAGKSTAASGDFSFATYDSIRPSEAPRTCDDESETMPWWLVFAGIGGIGVAAFAGWKVFRRVRATHLQSNTQVFDPSLT